MDMTSITDAEIGGFAPIEGLKVGDKLVWKGPEYRMHSVPDLEQEITVHRLLSPTERVRGQSGSAYEAFEKDFTALFRDDDEGTIIEFPFDSRRFKRV